MSIMYGFGIRSFFLSHAVLLVLVVIYYFPPIHDLHCLRGLMQFPLCYHTLPSNTIIFPCVEVLPALSFSHLNAVPFLIYGFPYSFLPTPFSHLFFLGVLVHSIVSSWFFHCGILSQKGFL